MVDVAGYQMVPPNETVSMEPVSGGLAGANAQDLRDAAQRAYENARLKSFGARGELSSGLDRIDPTQDFNYSPTALRYMQDVQDYLANQNTGYNLTPMNVGTNIDKQTGALMPLTSGQLEEYAKSPVADQFYANFAYGGPGSEWDVGNLQFAPNQQYRLIDRATGKELYSGTGYEAGQNISQLAKGLFDTSGQKANWLIQEAAPGSDQWTQRYEHVPDANGFMTWLKMAAPMFGITALPYLGLAGAGGTAAGGAGGAAAAGTAAGTTAALGGTAAGGALAAAPAFGGITVLGSTAPSIAALAPTLATGTLGAALAAAKPGPVNYGNQVYDQPAGNPSANNEIVVTGTGQAPGAVSGLGAAITNAATTAAAADAAAPSTLDKVIGGLKIAGLVAPFLGGSGSSGSSGTTTPFGMGASNPLYSAKLPTPGVNGAFQVGGMGGNALPVPAGGDYTRFGMGSAPMRVAPSDIPQYGGVIPAGYDPVTLEWLGPQSPSFAAKPPVKKAMGGYAVGGPGTGRSDEIPAMLSDGEYVMDAETVALLGDGSNKAGAKALDKFRANIRKQKGRKLAQGKFSVKAKQPEAYLSGGR